MPETAKYPGPSEILAQHLAGRRDALLAAIRRAVLDDPELTTAPALAREEFMDALPAALDALSRRIASGDEPVSRWDAARERVQAQAHGLHRWKQGYSLTENVAEWRHVSECIMREIEGIALREERIPPPVAFAAMRVCSDFLIECVRASADRHAQMQRAEATDRAAELREALMQVRALEHQRARTWREAVHDLRGSVGMIANASTLLARPEVREEARQASEGALKRGLVSLRDMLNDLATLARIEAGQEPVRIAAFDVSGLLRELGETVRPFALMHGLALEAEGPQTLEIEGDRLKIHRIAQNLLLNAVRYTERGSIRLSWHDDRAAPLPRWVLTIQDTGAGFAATAQAPIASALREHAPRSAQSSGADADHGTMPAAPLSRVAGEGIGLSIVKRLCELLDASITLESEPGRGSKFCVTFPARYRPGSQ